MKSIVSVATVLLAVVVRPPDSVGAQECETESVCHCFQGDNCESIAVSEEAARLLSARPGFTRGPCQPSMAAEDILAQLPGAADELGLTVNMTENMVLRREGVMVVAAPNTELAGTPPSTMLAGGFDLGVVYIQTPNGFPMPDGFYSCRASLTNSNGITGPGRYRARVTMRRADGAARILNNQVAYAQSARLVRNRRATVSGSAAPRSVDRFNIDTFSANVGLPGLSKSWTFKIWWLCENGSWVCVTFRIVIR